MTEPVIAQRSPMPVEVEAGRVYFWCACGRSAKQPFCDGSHAGTTFQPVRWKAEISERKFFCCCKHSGGKPFCDGTHSTL